MVHVPIMKKNSRPVLKKTALPWYDSNLSCLILAAAMIAVVLFGIDGIRVARRISGYEAYSWIPLLLVMGGLFVFASCVTRMIRRRTQRD